MNKYGMDLNKEVNFDEVIDKALKAEVEYIGREYEIYTYEGMKKVGWIELSQKGMYLFRKQFETIGLKRAQKEFDIKETVRKLIEKNRFEIDKRLNLEKLAERVEKDIKETIEFRIEYGIYEPNEHDREEEIKELEFEIETTQLAIQITEDTIAADEDEKIFNDRCVLNLMGHLERQLDRMIELQNEKLNEGKLKLLDKEIQEAVALDEIDIEELEEILNDQEIEKLFIEDTKKQKEESERIKKELNDKLQAYKAKWRKKEEGPNVKALKEKVSELTALYNKKKEEYKSIEETCYKDHTEHEEDGGLLAKLDNELINIENNIEQIELLIEGAAICA